VIVVTGMHRSGTSLVCQLLAAMGAPFGDESAHLPADRWNPRGYFERRDVLDLNSRIVSGLPRTRSALATWIGRFAYASMPSDRAIARRARRRGAEVAGMRERCRDLAVKDPRFCLTLRYWDAAAPIERIVVCLRDPAEVIASIRRRDRMPAGMAGRFYVWHLEALLSQLPLDRTVFVDTGRLATGDVSEVPALRRFLGLDPRIADEAVLARVVDKALFSPASPRATALHERVRAVWERLRELARQRHEAILATAAGGA
jgi:hypothetical protein